MTRLIDADALFDSMNSLDYESTMKAYETIANAPTIDAVPVVRCKDCEWRNWETNGCDRNPCVEPWFENDFCSYGERKDNED